MGINVHTRLLLYEQVATRCTACQKVYDGEKRFCPTCGSKLLIEKIQVYANFGKKGLTSYTYRLPGGISINSHGTMTLPLAKGISYTSKKK